jgi:hypothetical protein
VVKNNVAALLVRGAGITAILAHFASLESGAQISSYRIIIERNAFGLKPQSAPSVAPVILTDPRSKITLTGITTILGDKRVLLRTSPPPGNPGEPARFEQWYILAEGQSEAGIQIVHVDELAGAVTVNNAGAIEFLKLDEHLQNTTSAGPPPPPAVLPVPLGALASRE